MIKAVTHSHRRCRRAWHAATRKGCRWRGAAEETGVGDLVSGPLHNSEGLQQQHLLFGWKLEPRPAGKQALPVMMNLTR